MFGTATVFRMTGMKLLHCRYLSSLVQIYWNRNCIQLHAHSGYLCELSNKYRSFPISFPKWWVPHCDCGRRKIPFFCDLNSKRKRFARKKQNFNNFGIELNWCQLLKLGIDRWTSEFLPKIRQIWQTKIHARNVVSLPNTMYSEPIWCVSQ